MRIAFFQRDLPSEKYGGVANQVHLLANALSEKGEKVTVFTLSAKPVDALYDVVSITMPAWIRKCSICNKYLPGYFFAQVNTREFDVIHTHGDNFLMVSKKKQVRTFYGSALAEALHARSLNRRVSQLVFWVLEIAGTLIAHKKAAISPGTKKYIPLIHRIIPCGVDLGRFCPGTEKSKDPTILFMGALHSRKRGDLMLAIFKKVRERIPQARLWMVCPDPCKGEGITHYPNVTEAELIGLFQKAWIFCSLSTYEGFGVPLVESMACGTPVVSTRNIGSQFVLEDGKYGMLGSDDEMADCLCCLLEDREKAAALSEKGLNRVRDFDIRKVAETYIDLYHEAIHGK